MTSAARRSSIGRRGARAARASALALFIAAGCSGSIGDGAPGSGTTPAGGTAPGGNAPGGGTSPGGGNGPGGIGTGVGGGSAPGGGNNPGGGSTPGGGTPAEAVPAQPGHMPLRRLTRSQYNNTIHDLLGIAGDPAGAFGVDEEDAGFAANSLAPLKDLQIEKYQQAADDLADKAVANLGNLVKCPTGTADGACAEQFIRSFGRRAYRRPLTPEEVSRHKTLFDVGHAGKDLAGGIALVLSAMLQSPHFLYRVEVGDGAGGKEGVALTGFEVGTRLSYFLVNSTPDEALLDAAEAGKLKTPEGIAAEARRLLASAKARETVTSFFEQFLQIDDILTVEKDAKAYPVFTPEVRAAMRDEVLEFVDQIVRVGDGKLESVLTSRTTHLRGPLYPIYGLGMASNAGGSILKKLEHPADQRAGVFTLAGLMSKHGHADQSSPVGRGYLIASRILCQVPPPPPPGADNNVPPVDPNVPTRQRFEKHREKPECASCHALMDPLGVPFEIYDGVGRYRTMDGARAVDATSELKGTKGSDGPVKNAIDLMTKLARAEETRACFARQMFRYAFGRSETQHAADAQILTDALAALGKTDRIPDLMVAIASAPGFRTRVAVDR